MLSFWLKFVEHLKISIPLATKKYITPMIIKALGVSGGFYTWLVNTVLKVGWQKAKPYTMEFLYKIQRSITDKKNLKKLKENESNGATSNEKIEDELDFLNGNKPKP